MLEYDSAKVAALHRELHSHLPSDPALRVKVLESLLVDKGMIDSQTIDSWVEVYSDEIGPKRGAHVVAKAWSEPDFKKRLMADAPAAIEELGYLGVATGHLKAVENTPKSQPRRLYAVLLLPVLDPGHCAQLVQDRRSPRARRARSSRRLGRVRRRDRRRRRGARVGQHRRAALPRPARTPRRH